MCMYLAQATGVYYFGVAQATSGQHESWTRVVEVKSNAEGACGSRDLFVYFSDSLDAP